MPGPTAPGSAHPFSRTSLLACAVALTVSLVFKVCALQGTVSNVKAEAFLVNRMNTSSLLLSSELLELSFGQVMHDLIHSGAVILTLMVLIGSAIVPLVKHLFLFWALLELDPKWDDFRLNGLRFFDQLGRLSLVDVFSSGFFTCVNFAKVQAELGRGTVRFEIVNTPALGLMLGVSSWLLSAIVGQFMLHAYSLPAPQLKESASVSLTRRAYEHYGLVSGVSSLLVLAGVSLSLLLHPAAKLVSFQLQGLAGSLIEQAWIDFNLVTIPSDLRYKSQSDLFASLLNIVYVSTVIAGPILLTLGLAVLWFAPLSLASQRKIVNWAPRVIAMCGLDAFLLTTVSSYLELHLISQFIFDDRFPQLCADVKFALGESCIDLGHRIHLPGIALGVTAVCTILGAYWISARFVAHVIDEELDEEQGITSRPWTMSEGAWPGGWHWIIDSRQPLLPLEQHQHGVSSPMPGNLSSSASSS